MSNFRIYCSNDFIKDNCTSEHILSIANKISFPLVLTREFIYNNYECVGIISSEKVNISNILNSYEFMRFKNFSLFMIIFSEEDSALCINLPVLYNIFDNKYVYNNSEFCSTLHKLSLDITNLNSSETIDITNFNISDNYLYTVYVNNLSRTDNISNDDVLNLEYDFYNNYLTIKNITNYYHSITFSSQMNINSLYDYYKNNLEMFNELLYSKGYYNRSMYKNVIFDYKLNKAFIILENHLQELDYSPPVNVTAQVIIKNDPHPEILKYELNDKVVYFKYNQIFAY